MKPHNQARANAARQRQAETGESYATALQAVRRDRPGTPEELARAQTSRGVAEFHAMPVPEVLTQLVRYHTNRIARYLHFTLDEGRWASGFAEWQAMTLYKLTDAQEHLQLLIGTIGIYLRNEGVHPYFLRRYLQVNDDRKVEAYFTPAATEHLAGLTGQEPPGTEVVWHAVGRSIAEQTERIDAERSDRLEAALHALFGGYPDDDQSLDQLPAPIRDQAVAFIDAFRKLPLHTQEHGDGTGDPDVCGSVVNDGQAERSES